MILRLKLGTAITKKYKKNGMVYLPDFIIYDLDAEEYRSFWNELTNPPKKQLYTDGIQVYKVNWFVGVFQKLRGWFGFENHCDPNKIELTLAKIAYCGYLHGFNSQEIPEQLISPQFRHVTGLNRINQHSATLQGLMMSHYMTHSDSFSIHIDQAYPFGQSFLKEKLYPLLPKLDPQDPGLILKTVTTMAREGISLSPHTCFRENQFAIVYANFLASQHRLAEALHWSPQVVYKYKEQYIKFYLKSEEPNASVQAIKLIAELASSHQEEDRVKAYQYIEEHFTFEEQVHYLAPYPKLRNKIARGYVTHAEQEQRKSTFSKKIWGSKVIPLLARAIKLDPTLFDQNTVTQDALLKEEWILYLFKEAIKDKNLAQASTLFEKYPQFNYDKNGLKNLRAYYSEILRDKKNLIQQALEQHDGEQAISLAQGCLTLANHMARITPQEHPVILCMIDYAKTILAVDKINHANIKEADLDKLREVYGKLRPALLTHAKQIKPILNALLDRKIHCLIEQIRVPITFDSTSDVRELFMAQHQNQIRALKECLTEFIALNKGDKTKEMRPLLAKAYFLQADIILFYERNKAASLPYFKQSVKVMPENPYYCFHYYELTNDRKRDAAEDKIKKVSHFHLQHYRMWMEERWNEERVMSEGVDIHRVLAEDPGVLTRIGNMFSK